MGIKTIAAKILASKISKQLKADSLKAIDCQESILDNLIQTAKHTVFGKDHHFDSIKNYQDYKKAVPVRDYEQLKPYVNQIIEGKKDVLWTNKPIYFAKTSGTTSGAKYIPITKDSMPNHINSARNMLLSYIAENKNADFLNGKMIFLTGSPVLEDLSGIKLGRLSGIVNHHVPSYLQKNRLPSYQTNCIEDWETKLDKIVDETINQDMRLISGIPPWVQMYFDKIQERSGKTITEVFPNLQLLIHGGVNFSPYRSKLISSLGKEIDILETFPASEGFFAFQDSLKGEGLYLNVNSGIFFEFIPTSGLDNMEANRISLADVQIGVNYLLILNSDAGLWAYNIGDTIEFVSINPYRIKVTGRVKHYISAFGEHVIAKEVSQAASIVAQKHQVEFIEFTVAPQVNPESGLPYHEWFIAFAKEPIDLKSFAQDLDKEMCVQNSYYNDLIKGNVLKSLQISRVQANGFQEYMRSIGKLGGQNKVARLSNDRQIADALKPYIIKH